MNLLLASDSYPPEIRSAAHLMFELARELHRRGHRISVLTSDPRYNLSKDSPGREWREYATENGIEVFRVRTLPHHNVPFVLRGVAQLLMPRQFLRAWRRLSGGPLDAVIVYSPPLPLALLGTKLRRRGVRFILNVQDLFPQHAVDLGILSNPFLIAFYRWIEKRAYGSADVVTVHSENNRTFLEQRNPGLGGKLKVLHNWIDMAPYVAAPRSSNFRERYGLVGRFVFVFAGVMGPAQGLGLILRAAQTLRDEKDICFLFVGGGGEFAPLKLLALERGLENAVFQPFVSRERYPEMLKNFDVGLLCLSPTNRTPVVPAKLLGYMAAGLPVAGILNRESDGHKIIEAANCGVSIDSGDEGGVARALRRMFETRNDLAELGKNGFDHARRNYSIEIVVSRLEKLLSNQ